MFQRNEFEAEVKRNGLTIKAVAQAIGIDTATLYRKMSGNGDFYRNEIEKLIRLLNLSGEAVVRIFFAS